MWLPETAVDTSTLEVLATHDIAFTILAPHQARRVRPVGNGLDKRDAEQLDTSQPYLCCLPSGKQIVLFLLPCDSCPRVAFEGCLTAEIALSNAS